MPPEVKPPNNFEIEQALQEFEMKAPAVPQPSPIQSATVSNVPKMVGWVMKLSGGMVTERQAEYILLGFVAIVIVISFFLLFRGNNTPELTPEDYIFTPPSNVLPN